MKFSYKTIVINARPSTLAENVVKSREKEIKDFEKELKKLMEKYEIWTIWGELFPTIQKDKSNNFAL